MTLLLKSEMWITPVSILNYIKLFNSKARECLCWKDCHRTNYRTLKRNIRREIPLSFVAHIFSSGYHVVAMWPCCLKSLFKSFLNLLVPKCPKNELLLEDIPTMELDKKCIFRLFWDQQVQERFKNGFNAEWPHCNYVIST